jgi:hypothetical protein
VDFRAGLDDMEKRTFLVLLGLELRPLSRPARNQSLYRLRLACHKIKVTFFLIGIVGGGVQLGPLGTAATNMPIVPAPGDYDDGEIGGMIGRENRSTRRKPAPVPLCPPQTPHACPDANPGRCGGKPATDRLSYGKAKHTIKEMK